MALQADPVAVAAELRPVRHGESGRRGALMVGAQAPLDALGRPAHEGVLEQADGIVGERAVDRVLEIEHAGIGPAQHQVARHVVAVHVDLGLGQGGIDQQAELAFQGAPPGRVQAQAEMASEIPVGEQVQLAPQQRLVVQRQHCRTAGPLPDDERVDGITEQRVGIVRRDRLQHGLHTEVGQQQVAGFEVLAEHLGHMHPGLAQQSGDVQERAAVLLRRRGIHHDPAARAVTDAEVAAEAGVGGSRGEAGLRQGQDAAGPAVGLGGADVGGVDGQRAGAGQERCRAGVVKKCFRVEYPSQPAVSAPAARLRHCGAKTILRARLRESLFCDLLRHRCCA